MSEKYSISYKKAAANDIEKIFAMYKSAILTMEKNGIHQWDELYPDKEILLEDISKNQLTVGFIGEKIAVCYAVSTECDEQYANGKWEYPDSKFCVIHRLCVNPEFQNHGVAKQTLIHIEKESKKNGYDSIRLDSFIKNPFAQKMYESLCYKIVGTAEWRKGTFYLHEKKLSGVYD